MTQNQYGSPNTGTSGIIDLRTEQELQAEILEIKELLTSGGIAEQTESSAQKTTGVETFAAMGNGPKVTVVTAGLYEIAAFGSVQSNNAGPLEARVIIDVNGEPAAVIGWFGAQNQGLGYGSSCGGIVNFKLAAKAVLSLSVSTSNAICTFGNVTHWRLSARRVS
jgi:hypothetical protein